MSGLTGAMNTALTGLQAFEAGIGTVSENLTNQTTAGYAVENVNIVTAQDVPGQAGSGVQAPQIVRAADGFAAGLLRTVNSAAQAASVQASALTSISNALQNNGDVQSPINQFFQDASALAANPTSAGAQQTVLSDAQSVANAFQNAAGSIANSMTGANTALQQNVSAANNLLGQLAVINKGLVAAPNDPSLLNQQEAALNSLSQLLPVNVIPQDGGQVLVATGGTVLLDQSGAQSLALAQGMGATPPTLTVGSDAIPLAPNETDGSVGANLQAWQAGGQAMQGLNTLATIVAGTVNTAQAEGLTPTGQQGKALFSVPAPSVTPGSGNTGTATLTAQVTTPSQLPTDGGPFLLSNTASGWTATDQATNTAYPVTTASPPATTLAFAGMTVNVGGGAPANGDTFTINPAPGAAAGISVATANPEDIAAADPYVATPGALQSDGSISDTANAGNTVIGNDTVTSTPTSGAAVVPANYFGQSLQLTFTSTTGSSSPDGFTVETAGPPPAALSPAVSGQLTNGSGNIAIAYPVGAASGQYWQLPLSGTPATGDVVTIQPGGASSGSNAARMASLWTTSGTSTAGTLQQAVVGFGTKLGAKAQQAQQVAASTASQVTSATTNLQSISGVSTDQQAVLLTNYSQAYQAAAQVISTAHSMFESLLQAV